MSKFHPLRVASIRPETRDAVVVTFEVPEESRERFRYQPGQHLTLRTQYEGEELRRSYSICSAGTEQQLRIAIKRVQDGLFSNWANETLRAGSVIECMEPSGNFGILAAGAAPRHHVAFAAGSGITPILSMVKTILATEPHSRVTLVYGNRASSSVLFKDELADLKDRYLSRLNVVFVLSREQQDLDLFNGRIDREKCDALLKQWIDPAGIDAAYICGPQTMMEAVSSSLREHGVEKSRIKMELFDSGLPKVPRERRPTAVRGTAECSVTVIQDGRTRQFELQKNQKTLLDAALEQGVELPYSCKGGVCSTCRCKLVKGEVDMDANFALEDYEVARGYILTCQSFPVTDELVIDFDHQGG
jgi:ring-1,2-phenylacetyl-CoA epoxidase subunit PaaE